MKGHVGRKLLLFPYARGGGSMIPWLKSQIDANGGLLYAFDEVSGSYPQAYNTALAEGRQLALLTYAAYVAGAGWSNPSAQLATHAAAGGTATLAQAGLLQPGRTYKLVTIISGRTAGSVTPTGGAAIAVDGTNTQTITATGTALTYTPTTDFDGTINCATVALTQTSILASSSYPGAEKLTDGDMEAADTSAWTVVGTVAKNTTNPHGGSNVMRISGSGSYVNQPGTLTVGKKYRLREYARGDSSSTPGITQQGGADIWTGTSSTDWQAPDVEIIATGTNVKFRLIAGSGYVDFDDVSVTEVNPLNASNTGATIHTATGNPRLPYGYLFDGTNDYVNAYSNTLNSFFNPAAWSFNIFGKVSAAGVWTDGANRALLILQADGNNFILIRKTSTNNQLEFTCRSGGVNKTILDTSLAGSTALFMLTLTFDITDGMIAYINGQPVGTKQTGLGTWVGNLTSTLAILGAQTLTPTNVWSGIAGVPELSRVALTPAQIENRAKRAGVYGT